MITEAEREALKPVLGTRFSKDVKNILLEKKIYTKGADTYSAGFISNVYNGRYENVDVEAAIYELYDRRSKTRELVQKRKQALLKSKPVDGPPQV